MSPEGEKYGFGVKFKESSNQYYDMSASYPNGGMNVENQRFIDSLRTNLLKQDTNPNTTVTTSSLNQSAENQLQQNSQLLQNPSRNLLNNEIQNGTFHLKKTNGIHHDQSAPKL